ncbi:MAG: DUF1738 domain-containing protein [Armatimonadetes bacterium]|nr:DUF1738 domain-containing protein [Armatimonadota bacterium]
MNVLLLPLVQTGSGYASPWWLTFKQGKELAGHVRKGEKTSLVTSCKLTERRAGCTGATRTTCGRPPWSPLVSSRSGPERRAETCTARRFCATTACSTWSSAKGSPSRPRRTTNPGNASGSRGASRSLRRCRRFRVDQSKLRSSAKHSIGWLISNTKMV